MNDVIAFRSLQMTIRMATLDFFCNRPTVVALIEFGSQLSDSPGNPPTTPAKVVEESDTKENPEATVPRDVVKGLLGRGKSRVVFRLKLDMESARISVNKEDGSQLGMLAQDDFRFELKVSFVKLLIIFFCFFRHSSSWVVLGTKLRELK